MLSIRRTAPSKDIPQPGVFSDAGSEGIELERLGPVSVWRLTSASGVTRHDLARTGLSEPSYAFLLQIGGRATFSQYGRVAALEDGDMALADCSAPHACIVGERSELLMACAPAAVVREHLPSPEPFCGCRLRSGDGLSDSAIALTLAICDRLESGMSAEARDRVARNLLDMLATAFAVSFDSLVGASPVMCGRHERVKRYIEQHLEDPDLSPATIARSLKLSPRYLRMIFAMGGTTVSAYVLQRRLEECARDLADPRLESRSITEIAFSWGFNSAPHFSRSFGGRFGLPPRAYRRAALGRSVDESGALSAPSAA